MPKPKKQWKDVPASIAVSHFCIASLEPVRSDASCADAAMQTFFVKPSAIHIEMQMREFILRIAANCF